MITGQQLIQTIRDVAKEKPDTVILDEYRYNCNPEHIGDFYSQRCLLGEAFFRLGITIPKNDDYDYNSLAIFALWDKLSIDISPVEKTWCNCVQKAQDQQNTWAQAVLNADSNVKENV